jgi:hypothetical protein
MITEFYNSKKRPLITVAYFAKTSIWELCVKAASLLNGKISVKAHSPRMTRTEVVEKYQKHLCHSWQTATI